MGIYCNWLNITCDVTIKDLCKHIDWLILWYDSRQRADIQFRFESDISNKYYIVDIFKSFANG